MRCDKTNNSRLGRGVDVFNICPGQLDFAKPSGQHQVTSNRKYSPVTPPIYLYNSNQQMFIRWQNVSSKFCKIYDEGAWYQHAFSGFIFAI